MPRRTHYSWHGDIAFCGRRRPVVTARQWASVTCQGCVRAWERKREQSVAMVILAIHNALGSTQEEKTHIGQEKN